MVAVEAGKKLGREDADQPFKVIMALSGLFHQLNRANMAIDRVQDAASFLESRLLAVADTLPSIVAASSDTNQVAAVKTVAAELRATRKPEDAVQSLFDVARAFDRRVTLGRLL